MKLLFISILISFTALVSNASQLKINADSSRVLPAKKSVSTGKADSVRSYLTAGAAYGNTANYYGQSGAEKLPYITADVTYNHKSGLWFSVSPYKLLNYSGIAEFDIFTGYDYTINKQLNSSISYMRSFYPLNSPLLQSAYQNSLSASIKYDWEIFTTGLNATYAFGNKHDTFLSFNAARYIELGNLLDKYDYISFEPAFKLSGGTQQFYSVYEEKLKAQGKNTGNGKGKKKGQTTEIITSETTDTKFILLNYSLVLPLAYNRTHYTIEGSCQFSKPGSHAIVYSSNIQSFFSLSFYYLFF